MTCSICDGFLPKDSEAIEKKEQRVVMDKCNHVFHNSCLRSWLDLFINRPITPFCPACYTIKLKMQLPILLGSGKAIKGLIDEDETPDEGSITPP